MNYAKICTARYYVAQHRSTLLCGWDGYLLFFHVAQHQLTLPFGWNMGLSYSAQSVSGLYIPRSIFLHKQQNNKQRCQDPLSIATNLPQQVKFRIVELLPTRSEEREVLGVGSIPDAILPSCQYWIIIAQLRI